MDVVGIQITVRSNLVRANVAHEDAEAALAHLAFAMIDEDQPECVPRTWAVQQLAGGVWLPDRAKFNALLDALIGADLLKLAGGGVCFAEEDLRTYFAAVKLKTVGIKGRIAQPRLNPMNPKLLFGRQLGKWDPAIYTLTWLVPDVNSYIKEIADTDPFLATICLQSDPLADDGAYRHVKTALWSLVKSGKLEERRQAMAALYTIGDRSDLPAFLKALNTDRDFDVRISAANAVARVGGAEAIPTLLDVFNRITEADVIDAGTVQHQMGWAIASIGKAAVQPLLEALSHETDPIKRWHLLTALVKIGDPDATPGADVLTALARPDALETGIAAETLIAALERIATPEALAYVEAWRERQRL